MGTETLVNFTIVIPCFNERENIPELISRFSKLNLNSNVKIMLVDNGSNDGSKEVIKKFCDETPFLESIHIERNIGYGNGIVTGLKNCKTEFIGWTHADLQCRPSDVLVGIKIIEQDGFPKDIYVKGNRGSRALFDQFFTFGMSLFESIYFHKILFDINAQPNIFHRDFLNHWSNPPDDFSLDLYSLYMAKIYNLKITRFDVEFPPRIHGKSKWDTGLKSKLKFIKRTVEYSLKLKKELKI